MSSAKLAVSVLTCDTETRGWPSGSLDTPMGDGVTAFDI
jgi:hypothetical protein